MPIQRKAPIIINRKAPLISANARRVLEERARNFFSRKPIRANQLESRAKMMQYYSEFEERDAERRIMQNMKELEEKRFREKYLAYEKEAQQVQALVRQAIENDPRLKQALQEMIDKINSPKTTNSERQYLKQKYEEIMNALFERASHSIGKPFKFENEQ